MSIFSLVIVSSYLTSNALPVDKLCKNLDTAWTDRCVHLSINTSTFNGAVEHCRQDGGILLELVDEKTDLPQLHELMNQSDTHEAWIGMRSHRVWFWSNNGLLDDKKRLEYKNWAIGEPNDLSASEDRIELHAPFKFLWNDLTQERRLHPLCESLSPIQGPTVTTFNALNSSKTYFVAPTEDKNWTEASADCIRFGGQLIHIDSPGIQSAVEKNVNASFRYWTAGYWNGTYELLWNSGRAVSSSLNSLMPTKRHTVAENCVFATYGNESVKLNRAECKSVPKLFVCQYALQVHPPTIEPEEISTSPVTSEHVTQSNPCLTDGLPPHFERMMIYLTLVVTTLNFLLFLIICGSILDMIKRDKRVHPQK